MVYISTIYGSSLVCTGLKCGDNGPHCGDFGPNWRPLWPEIWPKNGPLSYRTGHRIGASLRPEIRPQTSAIIALNLDPDIRLIWYISGPKKPAKNRPDLSPQPRRYYFNFKVSTLRRGVGYAHKSAYPRCILCMCTALNQSLNFRASNTRPYQTLPLR